MKHDIKSEVNYNIMYSQVQYKLCVTAVVPMSSYPQHAHVISDLLYNIDINAEVFK